MDPAHVFVCYSSLSLEAARRIAGELGTPKTCYFFLLFDGATAELPEGSTVYQMRPSPHAYSEWTKPFALARWFKSALVQFDRRGHQQLIAYLPHPFELPANHFLYSDKRVVSRELLPDGLINYMDRTLMPETPEKWLRYLTRVGLRLVAAKARGLVYHPYFKGHITQYEQDHYRRTWGYSKLGYLTGRDRYSALPRLEPSRTHSFEPGKQVVLVLDQELFQVFRPKLERRVRARLVEFLRTQKDARLLYKQHPRGKNRHAELLTAGLRIEDVSGPDLAESLIAAYHPQTLVSFYSTPLLLASERVDECVAILPDATDGGVRQPAHLQKIIGVLRESGVRLLHPLGARTQSRA